MTRNDVTPDQAWKISIWLIPAMLRLGKLHERMSATGFPADDPLMQKVTAAKEATRLLRLELHDLERKR